jgi:hypothetical protein
MQNQLNVSGWGLTAIVKVSLRTSDSSKKKTDNIPFVSCVLMEEEQTDKVATGKFSLLKS